MNDYLSMGKFSKLAGIPISTLRYWDSVGLFAPARRDPHTKFRYYTPGQVITARFVSTMSTFGFSLQTIKEIQLKRTPEEVIHHILRQEKKLDQEMRRLRDCYSMLHTRLEMIYYGLCIQDNSNKFMTIYRDESAYLLGVPTDFNKGEAFWGPFMNFCNQAGELHINLGFPIACYHEHLEAFIENPGKPDHFISLDPSGNQIRPAGNYLVGFSRNDYGRFVDLPTRLSAYVREQNLKTVGPVFTVYLHDELCINDPSQYLCEVSVLLE